LLKVIHGASWPASLSKFELTTLPGRITLGVLVCQDIWAIVFLALQPNLHDPRFETLLESFINGAGLVS